MDDEEVRHHEPGREVEGDHQLPEHGLQEHAGHEAPRQPQEVPALGDSEQAAEHRQDDHHRHQAGEEAVDVLDRGVLARLPVGLQQALRQLTPTGQHDPSPSAARRRR